MEKGMIQIMLFYVVLVTVIFHAIIPTTRSQEVEDEREFNYVRGSEKGPERWGEIHPEWEKCNHGKMQSPIDLMNERVSIVSHLGRLKRKYKPSNATIINRGHDIMLKWVGGAGSIFVNGTEYILQQCHWHSPSEHTINGKRFDLEVHLVHESLDKKIAVVGITYTIGRPDTFLSDLVYHLKGVADTKKDERVVGVVDPRLIKLGSRKYYRYVGSLTVPPCTENVLWTIIRKVRTVSREQVRLLRDAVHDASSTNSRPVQPIKTHKVQMYRPEN